MKHISRSILDKKDLKKNENPPKFGSIDIHSKLTIDELNELSNKYNDLWKSDRFCDEYLKKLLPSSMLRYQNKNWNVIPLDLRLAFLTTLYQWVIKGNSKNLNNPTHNTLKGCIIWKYIAFVWKNYVKCFFCDNHVFWFCFVLLFQTTFFIVQTTFVFGFVCAFFSLLLL